MSYSLVYTDRFNACVATYRKQDPRYLAELMDAITELSQRPFGNPKLQSHPMKGVSGEKRFISYVGGSKGRRLIWSRFNRALVLLLYGEHDVEEQAERLVITYGEADGGLTIVETRESSGTIPQSTATANADFPPGQLFMAWTDNELEALGFSSHEVPILRRLENESDLLELSMAPESFELAFNLIAYQDPAGPSGERASADQQRSVEQRTRELRSGEISVEAALESPEARKHFLPVSGSELQRLLSSPIEDWMVFLHPDQADLVTRPMSGPARVRGAAGTGKTVVGLHRARHLARTHGQPVLFTTYVRNLPPVFGQLFTRLLQDEELPVDFSTLHKVAYRLVAQIDEAADVDTGAVDAAFAAAWQRTAAKSQALQDSGVTRAYLRQEIDWVIKGRGLTDLGEYLQLARTGRGTPLAEPARMEAWALYEEYQRQLTRRKARDFNDLLNRALELLILGRAATPYRSVVIDEAQDLTEMGLRLAFALAGGSRDDGLFILGDGQQSVYPGGVNLRQLGIDVRGRSTVLRVNYRNPRGVVNLAHRITATSSFDDLDAGAVDGDREVQVVREGGDPELHDFGTVEDHDVAMVARIEELAADGDTGPGDVAVLVPTNRMVTHYDTMIQDLGLETQKLERYDGVPNGRVKVGTFQRGKGLEFKRVLIPRVDDEGLGAQPRRGEDKDTHRERLELLRRQVFVAVTRARDGVWLGWVGKPSSLLNLPVDQEMHA